MKSTDYLKDLHIGKMIREIASQKQTSSKRLAEVLNRYTSKNADKIYNLQDMYIDDVVQISYVIEYNILEDISETYLSHLPSTEIVLDQESYSLTLDMQTQLFTINKNAGNCDFLSDIHPGQYIKEMVQKKGWTTNTLMKRLNCSQSSVSRLYQSVSIKIKRLIQLSNVFRHNLIADLYLSRMILVPTFELFDRSIVTINPQQIRIENIADKSVLMVYNRQNSKKRK